jgi:xanthine dehydrogenase accessory factor
MHSNDHEVIEQALRWQEAGVRSVLVTVLQTFGASPRPPGSMAIISEQGLIVGSVSGGCVEDDLVQAVREGHFWHAGVPTVIQREYGRDAAERERYRLPCGHVLRLAIETRWSAAVLQEALKRMRERQLLVRHLDYASGRCTLSHAGTCQDFRDDEQGLHQLLGPGLRLLLIGATEVSRYLAPIAQSLGYAVSICDPRIEYTGAWPADLDVPVIHSMPDDAVLDFDCDARTAVVTVTHDPKLDDLALMEALRSQAFYVGALGSVMNTARRKDRLRLFDVSDEQLARLRGPVGLAIGSRSPAEIAVSIAAELVQVRRLLDLGEDPMACRQTRPDWMPAPGPQAVDKAEPCTLPR